MYQSRFGRRGGLGKARGGVTEIERLEERQFLSSYFVSTAGTDANPGTLAQPFATIQQAANVAQPGDTVFIRGGTYRETVTPAHSGTASAPIIFENYNGESVTVSGADPLSGWTQSQGSIYSAPQAWDLGDGNNEVFVDGQLMTEARWPNSGTDLFHGNNATADTITSSTPQSGPFGGAATATITSSALTQPAGYWNGATIHIAPGDGWAWQTGIVVHSEPGALTYTYTQLNTQFQIPRNGNQFFLTGKFRSLDAPNEWFRDAGSSTLYLWTPLGDSPASHDVQVKHRQFAFDLSGSSFVTVRGVNLFAASINTSSSSHDLSLANLNAQYISQATIDPNPFAAKSATPTTGILLNGNNIALTDSTIAWSSGNGVAITGSDDTVQNCFIHDVGYAGGDESAILFRGSNNQALHNTIYNAGRNGITDYFAGNEKVLNNVVHDFGLMTSDAGGFYSFQTEGAGTEIARNLIYNGHGGGFGNTGLFLDNGANDFLLHHNVVWSVDSALKMNGPAHNEQVYNNTLVGVLLSITGYPPDMSGSILDNNILVGGVQWGTGMAQQFNLTTAATNSVFIDPAAHNYQLAAHSPAIDAGTVLSPYTDGYVGAAPDLGAYEYELTAFSSGASIVTPPVYTPPPTTQPPPTQPPPTQPPSTQPPPDPGPVGPTTHAASSDIAAGAFDSMSGVQADSTGFIAGSGSWVQYALVDFGTTGVKTVQMQLAALAKKMNLRVQLRLDSPTGPVLATLQIPGGKHGMAPHTQRAPVRKVTGVHALYLLFSGRTGQANVSSFSFIPIPPKKVHVKPSRQNRGRDR